MNRHAEANDIIYLGLEIRQDEISTVAGVARWAEQLAAMVGAVAGALA
jgi:predicted N-formylglutamate amidohydrolase